MNIMYDVGKAVPFEIMISRKFAGVDFHFIRKIDDIFGICRIYFGKYSILNLPYLTVSR